MENNNTDLETKIFLFIMCVIVACCFFRLNAIEGSAMFECRIHDMLYKTPDNQKIDIDGNELLQKLKFWEDKSEKQ